MIRLTESLQYIKNTNGNATLDIFIEDHEPIGSRLWMAMTSADLVYQDLEKQTIHLTEEGKRFLEP